MSIAGRADITLDAGSDFSLELYWTDYASEAIYVTSPIRMEVRGPEGNLVLEFYSDPQGPDLTNSGITYNSERGLIQLFKSGDQTKTITPGTYFYDLFVTYMDDYTDPVTGLPTSTPRLAKLMYGTFNVIGKVTKNV